MLWDSAAAWKLEQAEANLLSAGKWSRMAELWGLGYLLCHCCCLPNTPFLSIWLAGKKRIPGLQLAGAAQLQQQKLIDNLNFSKIWDQIGRYWLYESVAVSSAKYQYYFSALDFCLFPFLFLYFLFESFLWVNSPWPTKVNIPTD